MIKSCACHLIYSPVTIFTIFNKLYKICNYCRIFAISANNIFHTPWIYRELISLYIRAIFLFLRPSDQNIYSIDVIHSTMSFISFEFAHSYNVRIHTLKDKRTFYLISLWNKQAGCLKLLWITIYLFTSTFELCVLLFTIKIMSLYFSWFYRQCTVGRISSTSHNSKLMNQLDE